MNGKKLKKIRQQARITKKRSTTNNYLDDIRKYDTLFQDFPQISFLTHNVLESDRLISQGLPPQSLPLLQIPDNFQDTLFQAILKKYPMGDSRGDALWNQYTQALPNLDKQLRSFRDYLEAHYGMWAYIAAPFLKDLAHFINGAPTLEVMAGNGYISAGLQQLGQPIIATDSKDWTKENETGKHALTDIEPLSALNAWEKYQRQIKFVIMSWSPDGVPVDWQLLKAIRESNSDVQLICIGEKFGSSGSRQFWKNASYVDPEGTKKLNQHFSHFDLVHDQVYLIQ